MFFLSSFRSFRDITDVIFFLYILLFYPRGKILFKKKGLALGHKAAENSWVSAGPRKFWKKLLGFLHNFCDR